MIPKAVLSIENTPYHHEIIIKRFNPDLTSKASEEKMSEKPVRVGTRVEVLGKDVKGTVGYVGTTQFSSGKWVGVALDESKGKNDGTVQGKSYFSCPENHGIFVRQSQLMILDDSSATTPSTPSPATTPSGSKSGLPMLSGSSSTKTASTSKLKSGTSRGLKTPSGRKSLEDVRPMSLKTSQQLRKTESKEKDLQEEGTEKATPSTPTLQAEISNTDDKILLLKKDQENENLSIEVKDLSEKLETLRLKRSDDKIKLKEFEKTKIQLQQLLEFKVKISESQADLQKQLQQAKKEAKEVQEDKELQAEEFSDVAEMMEMATLDKEMAEEKCDALQTEVDQLKEKLTEITLDLEILRSEVSDKGSDGAATSYQVKQLEQQNERLKEALVKVRDLASHEKQEQQRLQKEHDHQKSVIAELSRTKQKLSETVEEHEKQVVELTEQVDAALGAEEMVEQLTDRNLALEEKVQELEETVTDLEALHDMNEELQENAKETECELREDVDMGNARVLEAQKKVEAGHETIADYELTIQKFRDLTIKLRESNEELRQELEKETNKTVAAGPAATAAESLDFRLKFAETKAFSKGSQGLSQHDIIVRAIDIELRKLDVQQLSQHITHLCNFMSDSFLVRGGDHDAIKVLLLVPRIISKSEILINQVKEKVCMILKFVDDFFTFKNYALNTCSIDLLMKIATLYGEMAVQENIIDTFIDLLRRDQLDENKSLELLEKSVLYFESLYSVHLEKEVVNQAQLITDHTHMFSSATNSIDANLQRIKVLLQNGDEQMDIAILLKDLSANTSEIKQLSKKIRRRLPADAETSQLSFGNKVQEVLIESGKEISKVVKTLFLLGSSTLQQSVVSPGGETGSIGGIKLTELAHQATDKVYGKDDSGPLECLRQVYSNVTLMQWKMENMIPDVNTGNKPQAPIQLRSIFVKNELKDNENMKYKIESREEEILSLKKAIKMKCEEISELNVRKDMAEKKMNMAGKDKDDQISKIERKLDEANYFNEEKRKVYHLQADIDTLEAERGEMKDKMKSMSKKALIEGLSKSTGLSSYVQSSPSSTPITGIGSSTTPFKESPILIQQIEELRLALRHVKNENIKLKAKQMQVVLNFVVVVFSKSDCSSIGFYTVPSGLRGGLHPSKPSFLFLCFTTRDMQAFIQTLNAQLFCSARYSKLAKLQPLNVPHKPVGLESKTGLVNFEESNENNQGSVAQLARKTGKLLAVVDISKRKPASVPVVDKAAPVNAFIEWSSKLNNYRKEVDSLRDDIVRLMTVQNNGQAASSFSSFPSTSFKKVMKERKTEGDLIGMITIPQIKDSGSKNYSILLNAPSLHKLHSMLVT
ncbi:Dynactin subunit 1 [Nymphon striatum]|nr:Dynactin subunit 1 [Nymphon striatum]